MKLAFGALKPPKEAQHKTGRKHMSKPVLSTAAIDRYQKAVAAMPSYPSVNTPTYMEQLRASLRSQLSRTTQPPREEEKEPLMITIKDADASPKNENTPKLQAAIDSAAIMQEFNSSLQVATGEAVERAFTYAEKLSKTVIENVRLEIAGINRPKVMVVEIEKVQHKLKKPATPYLARLLVNAKLGLNTMLVGPAGSGKTIAAGQVAEALGLTFGHVCLTAGASETWLFGRQTPNGFIEAAFSELFRQGGVFLADEMDAADPNLLLAINTALANGELYNPISGQHAKRHENFVFIGACNTFGKGADGVYTGRSRLDGATLTRFVKIHVDYSEEIEEQVCPNKPLRQLFQKARKKLKEMKSQEIVSTRCIAQAYQQHAAGVSLGEILTSFTLGWPEELVSQAGLNVAALEEEAPKKAKGTKKGVEVEEIF